MCEIIVINQSLVSGISTSVSKMSDSAGNLPRRFISFRPLKFESNADNLPDEQESENHQNIAETDEVNAVVVYETSTSPAKVTSLCKVHQ